MQSGSVPIPLHQIPTIARLFGNEVPVDVPPTHYFRNVMLLMSFVFAVMALYGGEVNLAPSPPPWPPT